MSGKPLALCGDSRELGVLEGRSQNFYDIPFPCLLVFLCSNILYFPFKEGIYPAICIGVRGHGQQGLRLEPSIGLNSVTVLVHEGGYEQKFSWILALQCMLFL